MQGCIRQSPRKKSPDISLHRFHTVRLRTMVVPTHIEICLRISEEENLGGKKRLYKMSYPWRRGKSLLCKDIECYNMIKLALEFKCCPFKFLYNIYHQLSSSIMEKSPSQYLDEDVTLKSHYPRHHQKSK